MSLPRSGKRKSNGNKIRLACFNLILPRSPPPLPYSRLHVHLLTSFSGIYRLQLPVLATSRSKCIMPVSSRLYWMEVKLRTAVRVRCTEQVGVVRTACTLCSGDTRPESRQLLLAVLRLSLVYPFSFSRIPSVTPHLPHYTHVSVYHLYQHFLTSVVKTALLNNRIIQCTHTISVTWSVV